MPELTKTFKVKTDDHGGFSKRQSFDVPWAPFNVDVTIVATLKDPKVTIEGRFDCDALDGKPNNAAKNFKMTQNKPFSLGTFTLGTGEKNVIVVSGVTKPAKPNETIAIQVHATT